MVCNVRYISVSVDLQSSLGGQRGPDGQVWTTHTCVSGHFFGIMFAASMTEDFTISPTSAGFGAEVYGRLFAKIPLYPTHKMNLYW